MNKQVGNFLTGLGLFSICGSVLLVVWGFVLMIERYPRAFGLPAIVGVVLLAMWFVGFVINEL